MNEAYEMHKEIKHLGNRVSLGLQLNLDAASITFL